MSFAYILIAVYILSLLIYAFKTGRHESRADFIIGGRFFSGIRVAFSIVTSWFSAGGLVYYYYLVGHDLPTMLFLTLGATVGLFIFSFFAPVFYRRAVEKHYVTMTEYVTGDIGPKSGLLCAILTPLLFLGYFLFELIASATLLSQLTDLGYLSSLLMCGGVVGLYLMLGGFKVLLNTDFIQALLLSIFAGLLIYVLIEAPSLDFTPYLEDRPGLSWQGFCAGFVAFFGAVLYGADTWQRVLCARSEAHARKGLKLASMFYLLAYGGLALLLVGFFNIRPDMITGDGYAHMVYDFVPAIIGSFILLVLIAAMMSTLDTIMFIVAQAFTTDLAFQRGKRLEKPMVTLRIAIAIVAIGGMIFAYFIRDIEFVFWFVVSYWVCVSPAIYLFVPKHKPSDHATALTMLLLALIVSSLHLVGLYQDGYVLYLLIAGLLGPLLFETLIQRKAPAT